MNNAFKRARKRSGLTQCEVAKMLHTSQSSVCKMDKDSSRMTLGQFGIIYPALTTEGREIMSEYVNSFFAV